MLDFTLRRAEPAPEAVPSHSEWPRTFDNRRETIARRDGVARIDSAPHYVEATQAAWPSITTRPATSRLKRIFDVVGAAAMLLALSPVMLSLAVLIRRDGGPALFRHKRIGADGKSFYCLKFRSMCVDAERRLNDYLKKSAEARAEWERDFKLRNDPRVTPLGAVLRRTSLDELPQLINVLRGEMSLVGPRPIVSDEIARYGTGFAAYRSCRPGITGLWQVSGRNDVDYHTRVTLDCNYVSSWSLANDLVILARTVGVVMRRSGAY